MRIPIDPVPLVVGIYAHVGELLARAAERRQEGSAASLAQRYARQREAGDKEVKRLVRTLHSDVKTADKLLKKTSDVWKISQETDLVDLVIQTRDESEPPKAYVLLKPAEIRELLASIRDGAKASGESEETIAELDKASAAIEAKASEYLFFGFSPWGES
jgi:hypothetical protein